ncbi:MAG TPA: biopolymer transporter ExbD [Myxococcaceae bacterium]|nr:biopolymer transporter ExbD [Myxococcaceae bacterium]
MSLGAKYHLHKKRKYAINEGRPNSDINVTPLVDVVLVLLIIFMVVTPLLEKDIQVRVPDEDTKEIPQEDLPPDQLVVTIDPNGTIKLNSEQLDDEAFKTRIKRALAAKTYEEKIVFFIPDDKAPYPRVVQALDWTRAAGAYILGVVTEPVAGILPGGETAPGTPAAPGGAPAPSGAPPPPAPATGGSK